MTTTQFEITPDARVFREVWPDKTESIAKLPIAIWVRLPALPFTARPVIACDCPVGWQVENSAENARIFKSAGMMPIVYRCVCACYGRIIE